MIPLQLIERAVCLYFNVTPDQLLAPSRERPVVHYRQIAMALGMTLGHSSRKVAQWFGKTDHTTAIYAQRAVEANPELFRWANIIMSELVSNWSGVDVDAVDATALDRQKFPTLDGTDRVEYVRADLVDGVENEWRKDWEKEKARGDEAEAQRDRFRAVLEGAGYRDIDAIANQDPALCRALGEVVARRTIEVIAHADRLAALLAEAAAVLCIPDEAAKAGHDTASDLILHLLGAVEPARAVLAKIKEAQDGRA